MDKASLILSDQDVRKCISMGEMVETVEEVFKAHGENKIIMPTKITLDMKKAGYDSWINSMPCYVGTVDGSGMKWAGGFIHNAKKGMPYVMATIILNDPDTGYVLAVMDGAYISNVRTGGAAAVSAKYTAKKDSGIITFIGAGMQARMTLPALIEMYDIFEIRAADIDPKASECFKREMEKEFDVKVTVARSNQEAVEGSDIIFTATHANEALLKDEWLGKGCTVVSLGSYQELDEDFILAADKIVVDDWLQCSHRGELKKLAEAGLITKKMIHAELGEIIAGKTVGRESDEERIVVIPIGLGAHDIAIGTKVYRNALKNNIGLGFDFLK